MSRRVRIRSWILLALTLALAAMIGFSFVRPVGVMYARNYRGETYATQYYRGLAFHEGGLVFFEFVVEKPGRGHNGLYFVAMSRQSLRGEINSAMHPMEGYSTTVLGVKLGFHYPSWGSMKIVVVPAWMILLLLGLPLGRGIVRVYVRQRRERRGCCGQCGYDLRGSGARCPECGSGVAGPI